MFLKNQMNRLHVQLCGRRRHFETIVPRTKTMNTQLKSLMAALITMGLLTVSVSAADAKPKPKPTKPTTAGAVSATRAKPHKPRQTLFRRGTIQRRTAHRGTVHRGTVHRVPWSSSKRRSAKSNISLTSAAKSTISKSTAINSTAAKTVTASKAATSSTTARRSTSTTPSKATPAMPGANATRGTQHNVTHRTANHRIGFMNRNRAGNRGWFARRLRGS